MFYHLCRVKPLHSCMGMEAAFLLWGRGTGVLMPLSHINSIRKHFSLWEEKFPIIWKIQCYLFEYALL